MAVSKCIATTIFTYNQDLGVNAQFYDGTTWVDEYNLEMADTTQYTSPLAIRLEAEAAVFAYATLKGYSAITSASNIIWANADVNDVLPGPSSYQTIVSQTGTAAPAVSSLTPVSSYPAGTTFTWARTGAGVYTLTASTAVFNTSGKTGVFISPLNNLNASVKAVVTSTTVITVTTAVQSVAVLGLLGLTATNTDALLTNTMIYVQTYS